MASDHATFAQTRTPTPIPLRGSNTTSDGGVTQDVRCMHNAAFAVGALEELSRREEDEVSDEGEAGLDGDDVANFDGDDVGLTDSMQAPAQQLSTSDRWVHPAARASP